MAVRTHTGTDFVSPLETADRQTPMEAIQPEGGYDFHHPAVLCTVPPPTVRFDRPLRWWSLDRRRRLAAIMHQRDRLQHDILRLAERRAAALSVVCAPSAHHMRDGEEERFAISPDRLTGDAAALA